MSITSIIIDDEWGNIENLSFMLAKYCPEVIVLDSATSAAEGIAKIQTLKPQLVFLDIEMPHASGFDMLEKLMPVDFEIIFVTAYNQYAIRAIRFCALDYLLKPIDITELQAAIKRVG